MVISEPAYRAAKPVGARCGSALGFGGEGTRNTWRWVDEVRPEMERLWNNELDPLMSEAEHADARAKLKTLIAKAGNGTLLVQVGGREAAPLRWTIVELKPFVEGRKGAFGRAPRLMRLYLGEPESYDALLLGLHLANKTNGDAGKAEQDEAIDEAIDRANRWAAA